MSDNLENRKMTPEEIEMNWYRNVYQGDNMPQLTLRAVLMGTFLGGFMALSNLYVGLKTGWGLGVAITSCILSFAIYKSLTALSHVRFFRFLGLHRVFRTEISLLENNCMQSTASSAGYSTGSTMVSAIAAYLMISGVHLSWPILAAWTFFIAALGVVIAIPMKRQMINVEQLKFPSGIAAAETLKSLHSQDAGAVDKARALGIAGLIGAVIVWLREAGRPFAIPPLLQIPGTIANIPLVKWTIAFENSAIMMAAGGIIGLRMGWSLLLGAIINYGFLAPKMVELGAIDASKLGYRTIVAWSTWAGASMMVSAAILAFALQGKTILRAFKGIGKIFSPKQPAVLPIPGEEGKESDEDMLARIEVPSTWFITGTFFSGLGCLLLLYFCFQTSLVMGIISVLLTFILALVACRVTGESDITPAGAMGKISQLLFGILAPTNITTNLMTASVTAAAASSSADLLTDLKSGYLLGANPRQQFLAQFFGIFVGVAVVVPAFYILVPTAADLGTDRWPAPAAQVWKAVALLLAQGLDALHPTARYGLFIGLAVGFFFTLLEHFFPKYKAYIPSPIGLGLAMVIPFFNSLSMFIGAVIATILYKKYPAIGEKYVIPVCSGIIAGESLLGIFIAIMQSAGLL